ncbi:hypothetical protein P8452_77885 [Trifolium repens]|nr:hypothetical protein P8452_77885 [Trifolium repens]
MYSADNLSYGKSLLRMVVPFGLAQGCASPDLKQVRGKGYWWRMTEYKYTEELCSSMQTSIKGSLGQRRMNK